MKPAITFAILSCCALTMAGCAETALNGGYTSEAPMQMTSIARPEVHHMEATTAAGAEQPTTYAYRGGRDPVTGQAVLRN